MYNSLLRNFCALFFITSLSFSYAAEAKQKTVGIIVPLEHEAMIQIVSGIKQSLKDKDVSIEVKNAHSDPNLMLAIIKQMKDQDIDIIMPIGTSTTQMTLSHIKNRPVIGVAALADESANPFVTGVNDEIPITASISGLPKLRNIAVIYSASEKVAPEVEELKAYGAKHGVLMHLAMVQTMVDLPAAVRSAPKETQAFLVLKDHIVVSGINIVTQEAGKRAIPVIASDEGSVIKGASIAQGVKEKDIGIESGIIAKKILEGVKPCEIPHKTMNQFVIFVNEKAFAEQDVLTEDDIKALKIPIIKI